MINKQYYEKELSLEQ